MTDRSAAEALSAADIIERHIIRVARYYWPKGSHIETFAREALAALDRERAAALTRYGVGEPTPPSEPT